MYSLYQTMLGLQGTVFEITLSFLCYKNSRTAQLGSEPGSGRLAPRGSHTTYHTCALLWPSFSPITPSLPPRLLPFEMSEQNLHCVLIWLWQLFDQVLHSRDTLSWFLFWKRQRMESLCKKLKAVTGLWNLVFGVTQWHLVVIFKISGGRILKKRYSSKTERNCSSLTCMYRGFSSSVGKTGVHHVLTNCINKIIKMIKRKERLPVILEKHFEGSSDDMNIFPFTILQVQFLICKTEGIRNSGNYFKPILTVWVILLYITTGNMTSPWFIANLSFWITARLPLTL